MNYISLIIGKSIMLLMRLLGKNANTLPGLVIEKINKMRKNVKQITYLLLSTLIFACSTSTRIIPYLLNIDVEKSIYNTIKNKNEKNEKNTPHALDIYLFQGRSSE